MRLATVAAALALAAAAVGDPSAAPITVRAGADLQEALNTARPGDVIVLERGATFIGNFVLPARPAGDDRVITLQTEDDRTFPPEGTRISPLAAPRLAKLRSPNGQPALRTAAGTHHWRIALLEFQANQDGVGDIIALGDGSAAQHAAALVPSFLTLDRLYIHGDRAHGQKRAIALNSAETVITGCYIADIMAIGLDSQAIAGWNGPGGYLIANSFLEAAGENVLFGGADPSIEGLTPERIVIRDNVISKPAAWRAPDAPRWQVKNLLELKNARDVLIEHNLFERSWQQAQAGYAILFTVRNQDGRCPWCQVERVRFQHNTVRDVAAGLQILGEDNLAPSRRTTDIRVADNLFDGVDRSAWGGDGFLLLLSEDTRGVVITHNTVIQGASGGLVKIANGRHEGFVFTANVASHGDYGFHGADHGVGNDSIATYLPGAEIRGNVIAGANPRLYPPDNLFPSRQDFEAEFMGFGLGDFRLRSASAWHGAAFDGRALGADLDALPQPQRSAVRRAIPRRR
jgi:hypothetical protein